MSYRYDPLQVPDPDDWLEIDEGERIELVREYHEQFAEEMGSVTMHVSLHAVVENQLALAFSKPPSS